MKANWKIFKIVFASALIIAIIFFAVDFLSPDTYNGTSLNFSIGRGSVTITNPSAVPIPVQIVSTGTRGFRVTSAIEGVSGTSARLGSGSTSTQLLEFALPQGVSEFTVTGGTSTSFVANSETALEASVQSVGETEARVIMIIAALIILGLLFFISRSMEHSWIKILRRQEELAPVLVPVSQTVESAQGPTARSYGDNRK
jgi:hypothetical protein